MVWKQRRAPGSPSIAAWVICGPEMPSGRPPPSCSSLIAPSGVRRANSRASATRALPLQYCSQQPRFPQPHSRPSGTTRTWPGSPAIPQRPRYSSPLTRMAAPIPVPTFTIITSSKPRAAPNLTSAQAEALASFSTTTSRPMRSSTRCFSGSSRQARCGANSIVARSASTNPAAPSPIAVTSRSASSSMTTSAMACSVCAGLAAGGERFSLARIWPSASTTPAATFVPPTSTPMARVIQRSPDLPCPCRPGSAWLPLPLAWLSLALPSVLAGAPCRPRARGSSWPYRRPRRRPRPPRRARRRHRPAWSRGRGRSRGACALPGRPGTTGTRGARQAAAPWWRHPRCRRSRACSAPASGAHCQRPGWPCCGPPPSSASAAGQRLGRWPACLACLRCRRSRSRRLTGRHCAILTSGASLRRSYPLPLQYIGCACSPEMPHIQAFRHSDPSAADQWLMHMPEQCVPRLGPFNRVKQCRAALLQAPGHGVVEQLGDRRRNVGAQDIHGTHRLDFRPVLLLAHLIRGAVHRMQPAPADPERVSGYLDGAAVHDGVPGLQMRRPQLRHVHIAVGQVGGLRESAEELGILIIDYLFELAAHVRTLAVEPRR